MTTVVMEKPGTGLHKSSGLHAASELALRITAAILQILATLAVVRSLAPPVAGVYFEGFVIAYTLAAILRGKYEMLILRYVLGESAQQTSIPVIALIRVLARRVLIRSVLTCGALLVVTADLDIMEPRLQPFLETYLPFVLAVPFVAVALFLSAALRAAQRSLGSTIIAAYAINLAVIVVAVLTDADSAMTALSWAFLGGAILASVIGALLVRKVFPAAPEAAAVKPSAADWREIYGSAAFDYGLAGIALAGLQWGPICVLALLGPPLQIAEYAVATRLAQIIELMMPALIFLPIGLSHTPRLTQLLRSERGRLLANLAVSAAGAAVVALVLMILVPQLLDLFGSPYESITGVFTILLASQWINAGARPALRFMTTQYYKPVLRALCVSALIAVGIALFGTRQSGATAAALAVLAGTLLLNAHSFWAALRQARSG